MPLATPVTVVACMVTRRVLQARKYSMGVLAARTSAGAGRRVGLPRDRLKALRARGVENTL